MELRARRERKGDGEQMTLVRKTEEGKSREKDQVQTGDVKNAKQEYIKKTDVA